MFSKGVFVLRTIMVLLWFPIKKIGAFIFELLIVPVYNLYYKLKARKTPKSAVRARSVSALSVAKSHIPHIVFGIVLSTTSVYNLNSHTFYAEDFGVHTPVYALTQGETDESVETAETPFPLAQTREDSQEETVWLSSSHEGRNATEIDTDDWVVSLSNDDLSVHESFVPPSLQTKTRGGIVEYMVEDGDTISSIAQSFHISVNTILWENNLTARSVIRPGNILRILPFSGIRYVVKRGDTIGKIASRFQIPKEEILSANRLADDATLALNQTIFLPGAKPISRPQAISRSTGTAVARLKRIAVPEHHAGYLWPSPGKKINQYFSWKHPGIDIDNLTLNDTIYASLGGVIEKSGWGGAYGNQVDIRHSDGTLTRYGHLKTIYVKRGSRVEKGDVLGIMGTTGRSTGIHLHFEIIINGKRVNPLSYL